jgi:NADH dehydrogenase
MTTNAASGTPHILIVGGGYVGMYTALRLQKKLRRGEARVTVIDPRSYMTYQPFLPEAAAGNIEPRHVVVPLRPVLPKCDVLTGRVTRIDHARKVVTMLPPIGEPREISYDIIVVAPGSVARTLPIPGLAEHAIGFKQVEEAIALRNRVVEQFDIAQSSDDPEVQRKALTFVFVGGGFAGVEAVAELEDMARFATRYYSKVSPKDLRFVLVEAANRILPEVGEEMGRYTVERLKERGFDLRLETRLESCVDNHVVLSDGTEFDASTVVWTAGVKANPVVAASDLPVDERGRLKGLPTLEVEGVEDAWTAGDCAAIPDLANPGQFCSPSAQHAVRQAKVLGSNIVRKLRGREIKDYHHKHAGSVASLGLRKGVAQVYGIKLKGYLAWQMHRMYHLSRVPTLNRKARVQLDWILGFLFQREVVSLGSLHRPYEVFREVATPGQDGQAAPISAGATTAPRG